MLPCDAMHYVTKTIHAIWQPTAISITSSQNIRLHCLKIDQLIQYKVLSIKTLKTLLSHIPLLHTPPTSASRVHSQLKTCLSFQSFPPYSLFTCWCLFPVSVAQLQRFISRIFIIMIITIHIYFGSSALLPTCCIVISVYEYQPIHYYLIGFCRHDVLFAHPYRTILVHWVQSPPHLVFMSILLIIKQD